MLEAPATVRAGRVKAVALVLLGTAAFPILLAASYARSPAIALQRDVALREVGRGLYRVGGAAWIGIHRWLDMLA